MKVKDLEVKEAWAGRIRYRLRELLLEKSKRDRMRTAYSVTTLAKETGLSRRTLNVIANNEITEVPGYVLARLYAHFELSSWDQLIEFVEADNSVE